MASTAEAKPTETAEPPEAQTSDALPTSAESTAIPAPTGMDPVASLTSMWSSWMTPLTNESTPQGQAENLNVPHNDWLTGAGKMWETAVADMGTKLKEATSGVDTKAIGEQVEFLKKKSGRFVEDVSKSVQSIQINPEEISKRASVISTQTRAVFEQAGESLERSRKEALEIFIDADARENDQLKVAPWDAAALPENERPYADALRQEMLKIVVDSIYSKKRRMHLFLSDDEQREDFKFDMSANSGMAMAALDADKNMRRLRAGLVPGKMTEDKFWTVYFYHVHRVRQALVANEGVIPEQERETEDEDPATLFADDAEDEELAAFDSTAPNASTAVESLVPKDKDGKRNWDDEIDAIFDDE